MSEEKKDFEIKDRRIFAGGEPSADAKEDAKDSESQKTEEQAAKESDANAEDKADAQLPEINFATFIISLNASAMVHLGVIDDPATSQKVKNLPMAKQTIDILGMLQEKTKGNLTKDEETMLKSILYDLRIIYVREKG
jgi:hypothetical protein